MKILLFAKTRELSSVSDWHDLQILALRVNNLSNVIPSWVKTLSKTFYEHANRSAYTMLEPRPSILEANVKVFSSVGYWPFRSICAVKGVLGVKREEELREDNISKKSVYITQSCRINKSYLVLFEVKCIAISGIGNVEVDLHDNESEYDVCSIIDENTSWKTRSVGGKLKHLNWKLEISPRFLDSLLPYSMDQGSLRFRLSREKSRPADFCWDYR